MTVRHYSRWLYFDIDEISTKSYAKPEPDPVSRYVVTFKSDGVRRLVGPKSVSACAFDTREQAEADIVRLRSYIHPNSPLIATLEVRSTLCNPCTLTPLIDVFDD